MRKTISRHLAVIVILLSPMAQADLIALTSADFGLPDVTFSEVALGTPIDGLTINGFTFSETVTNASVSDTGPGDTNTITQPSALSNFNPAGQITTIFMPEQKSGFGFAFALLTNGDASPEPDFLADAVTLTLFNGASNLGALVYDASADPSFAGGFVGIGSTTPFDSVQISFSASPGAYDFDNISTTAVPEPSTLALLGIGLFAIGLTSRRKA